MAANKVPDEVLTTYIDEWISNGGVKYKAYMKSHGCSEASAKANSSKFHKNNQEAITAAIRNQVGSMGWMIPHTLQQILKHGGDTAKIKALEMLLSLGLGIDKTTKIEVTNTAVQDLEKQQIDTEIERLLRKED